jgi:ribosomal protein L2
MIAICYQLHCGLTKCTATWGEVGMDVRADVRGSPLNSQDHGTGNGEQKPPTGRTC